MKEKLKNGFKKALSNEIAIDFRACVYFFCVVMFYCAVALCKGIFQVKILTLVEIVLTNYVICYVQTYLFRDFDESQHFGTNELAGILMCTFLYVAASLLFGWFDGSELITGLFAAYIILTYVCVILCFAVKRKLDTRQLNKLLNNYKQNEGRDPHEC
ncbi:MAG: DUF3021 family protein [Clostridia bacterium]|nr:DUF3021 family protein [Clostridia bacterium]